MPNCLFVIFPKPHSEKGLVEAMYRQISTADILIGYENIQSSLNLIVLSFL